MACLRECRKRGLQTAVDTCGFAARHLLLEVADLTDLVLYDIKHLDPKLHRTYTGVDNRIILENLRALCESGTEVSIRMPLIAGFNDGAADIEAVATFISSLQHPRSIHLLPYHGLAEGKLVRLEQADAVNPLRAPGNVATEGIVERLRKHDLEVTVGGRP
jgi:pyruvate formate lyase activating enzyme